MILYLPPILFQDLVNDVLTVDQVKAEVNQLLERKLKSEELDLEPKIESINDYIEAEISHLEQYVNLVDPKTNDPTNKLDQLFRKTLAVAWNP